MRWRSARWHAVVVTPPDLAAEEVAAAEVAGIPVVPPIPYAC